MKIIAPWFIGAALIAALVTAVFLERGRAQYVPAYQTAYQPLDANTVEGSVTNPGTGLLRIDGMVVFNFAVANSMSRQAIQAQGNALVPPGRTVSVARARLSWSLLPNETCSLDASGAVR